MKVTFEESLGAIEELADVCVGRDISIHMTESMSRKIKFARDLMLQHQDIEKYKARLKDDIDFAITGTGTSDVYSTGMVNGMKYVKSLIDEKKPEYSESPNIKTIEEVQDEMDYGKVYTSQYFKKMIEEGSLNSYDGGGYYHDGQNKTDISVWSKWTIDTTYPYVCWYSK